MDRNTPRRKIGERIRADQQVRLMARLPITEVLSEKQLKHLVWRGRLLADNHEDEGRCLPHVYALDTEGNLTYRFSVSTFAPQWHFHVMVHPTSRHLHKYLGSRNSIEVLGTMQCRNRMRQKEGLLAEINLVAEKLSEGTVVHETIHAAGHLARIINVIEARKLAARVTTTSNSIVWRSEIQCWTVDIAVPQILKMLDTLEISCVPLRQSMRAYLNPAEFAPDTTPPTPA